MALIDKETVRKEIERLIQNPRLDTEYNPAYQCGLRDLRAFLDSLPEQPVLPGIVEDERVGIPGRDFIPVEWVDACEKYGKWKIVKQEQPEVDFETEYAKFSNDPDALDYTFPIDLSDYKDFARHFYELGLNARKEDK